MKNIFGGCIGAFCVNDGGYHHGWMPLTAVTHEDEVATKKFFLDTAYQIYPMSEGWYGHYAGAVIVNESQVTDFLSDL